MPSKKRIEWVDTAKGIGMLLVIYGHALEGVYSSDNATHVFMKIQHGLIHSFHMPLFFVLSGLFVGSWLNRPFKKAISQKIFSLLLPYFVWSLVQGTIMVLTNSRSVRKLGWRIIALIPVRPIDQFWFIYDLFFAFIILYALNKLFRGNRICVLTISLILMFVFQYSKFWEFSRITYNLLFIVFGALIGNIAERMVHQKVVLGVSAIMFIAVAFCGGLNSKYIFVRICLAICGTLFVMCLSQRVKSKGISLLGMNSIEVYVTHWFFVAGSRKILMKIGLTNSFSLVLLTFAVGLFGSLLFVKLTSMIPHSSWLYGRRS